MKLKTGLMALLSVAALTSSAQVKLASIFTSNAVLQQQSQAPIWGWDKPGTNITITTSWNGKAYKTTADQAGKWRTKLATPVAGGPYTVTISDGKPIKLDNILIGEVWILGGQSNMEMPMKGFKGQPLMGIERGYFKIKKQPYPVVYRSTVVYDRTAGK